MNLKTNPAFGNDEPQIRIYGNRIAAIYGETALLSQHENLIIFRCAGGMRVSIYGKELVLSAFTLPKTVVCGKISEIGIEGQ